MVGQIEWIYKNTSVPKFKASLVIKGGGPLAVEGFRFIKNISV